MKYSTFYALDVDQWVVSIKSAVMMGHILTCKHRDGWPEKFVTGYDGAIKIYQKMWEQIAERFNKYGENLMFESMNEVGFDSVWNQYGGTDGKKEAFDMFNKINQKFVDGIRGLVGNNEKSIC